MAKMTAYSSVAGLNKALRRLPKQASAELREASVVIARKVADQASQRASSTGGVARLVAPTLTATRDRVPVVKMGGSRRLPDHGAGWEHSRSGSRQTVGDVIWGAEFGGGKRRTTQQFLPHLGTTGYFLWPTVRALGHDIHEEYSEALDDALQAMR